MGDLGTFSRRPRTPVIRTGIPAGRYALQDGLVECSVGYNVETWMASLKISWSQRAGELSTSGLCRRSVKQRSVRYLHCSNVKFLSDAVCLQMADCELGSQLLERLGDHVSVALGVVALETEEARGTIAEAVGEFDER